MLRRSFLQTVPAALLPLAAAETPVKLGFDTYSLRAFKWKGIQLLDYAAAQKLDTIQFSALEDYGGTDPENLRRVKDRAAQLKISIENHAGDMQARETRTVIEESGKDFVASCLDSGNPVWAIEDPFVTLEVLAPYVATTHVRDS